VQDRDTGKNLVLQVADEDRRFHIDPGANWLLDAGHVARAISQWTPDVVTLRPGYSGIDLDLDAVMAAAGDAVVLLDIMQPHPARPAGYLEAALRRADIVHCNEIEARVAMGVSTLDQAVGSLLAFGVDLILITAGGEGATAYTRTHRVGQPGYMVEAVDVTGCGDAFCAGTVMALDALNTGVIPRDPESVGSLLALAQAVGASAATAVGCVEGVGAALVDRLTSDQKADLLAATTIEKHTLAE
jgi:sugar/nucleoside kinase (ribokinase family)